MFTDDAVSARTPITRSSCASGGVPAGVGINPFTPQAAAPLDVLRLSQ